MKDLNESGKSEDDIVLDAMSLYKQKCGKAFVLKHCWLLLKSYPRFSTIFMGKRKGGGFNPPSRDALPVDSRDLLSPNGEAPSASGGLKVHSASFGLKVLCPQRLITYTLRGRSKLCMLMQKLQSTLLLLHSRNAGAYIASDWLCNNF